MDLDLTPTPTSSKSPEDTEIDTPPHINHPTKLLSFTNGALKHHQHHHSQQPQPVAYKECMRNHAASLGCHAVDGCGEFMPSPSATTSLKCAACGCHRNFHRREPESPTAAIAPPFLDFRHPPLTKRFSPSPSPPPLPPPPASHPYTALGLFGPGTVVAAEELQQAPVTPTADNPVGRKRFRTKFTREQKEKMHSFSEKLGWKMQKCDEAVVKEFCHEIGVAKGVLKVWMHNNKNTLGRKEINGCGRLVGFEDNGGRKSEESKIDNGSLFQNNGSGDGVHFQDYNNRPSSP